MSDLISRQAVKEWLGRWEGYLDTDMIARMQLKVDDIPTHPTPSNTLDTLDCVERQAAIDAFWKLEAELRPSAIDAVLDMLKYLPSVQPWIIRCKDCKWWDKEDDMPLGYCRAIKHGFYSRNWEISIRRTYPEDFFCADAELRGEHDDN